MIDDKIQITLGVIVNIKESVIVDKERLLHIKGFLDLEESALFTIIPKLDEDNRIQIFNFGSGIFQENFSDLRELIEGNSFLSLNYFNLETEENILRLLEDLGRCTWLKPKEYEAFNLKDLIRSIKIAQDELYSNLVKLENALNALA